MVNSIQLPSWRLAVVVFTLCIYIIQSYTLKGLKKSNVTKTTRRNKTIDPDFFSVSNIEEYLEDKSGNEVKTSKKAFTPAKIYGAENKKEVASNSVTLFAEQQVELLAESFSSKYIEGDINKDSFERVQAKLKTGDFFINEEFRWKNARIPYLVDKSLTSSATKAISSAIEDFHNYTCLRFYVRRDETDYINFTSGKGCSSSIGRQGGRQDVVLGFGCGYKGTVLHEMMHTLGFLHEHNRPDRDEFIDVKLNNIQTSKLAAFTKYSSDTKYYFNYRYDYASIMHLGPRAFGKIFQTSMKVRNPDATGGTMMGQRSGFSASNLIKLQQVYCGRRTLRYRQQHQQTFQQQQQRIQQQTVQSLRPNNPIIAPTKPPVKITKPPVITTSPDKPVIKPAHTAQPPLQVTAPVIPAMDSPVQQQVKVTIKPPLRLTTSVPDATIRADKLNTPIVIEVASNKTKASKPAVVIVSEDPAELDDVFPLLATDKPTVTMANLISPTNGILFNNKTLNAVRLQPTTLKPKHIQVVAGDEPILVTILKPKVTANETNRAAHKPTKALATKPLNSTAGETLLLNEGVVTVATNDTAVSVKIIPTAKPVTTPRKITEIPCARPPCLPSCMEQPEYPCWPTDYRWSYNGLPSTCNCAPNDQDRTCRCNCVHVYGTDTNDGSWNNNYLCYKQKLKNPNLKWSTQGEISGMKCVQFTEQQSKDNWSNNYLCVGKTTPYNLRWSEAGKIKDAQCIRINEPMNANLGWQDNFLCQ